VKRRSSLAGIGRLLPFGATCRRAALRIPRASEVSLYPQLLSGFEQMKERLNRIEAVLDRMPDGEHT
jgi:hypothetical protein